MLFKEYFLPHYVNKHDLYNVSPFDSDFVSMLELITDKFLKLVKLEDFGTAEYILFNDKKLPYIGDSLPEILYNLRLSKNKKLVIVLDEGKSFLGFKLKPDVYVEVHDYNYMDMYFLYQILKKYSKDLAKQFIIEYNVTPLKETALVRMIDDRIAKQLLFLRSVYLFTKQIGREEIYYDKYLSKFMSNIKDKADVVLQVLKETLNSFVEKQIK